MKPKEKIYKFKLYEEDLSNKLLIQEIRNAISTLPVYYFSFVIVELNMSDIPFFQTARERSFKKTQFYTFEIRLDLVSDNKPIWKIYRKNNQTKEQVLQAFDEICVRRIPPDLEEWEESDIGAENVNPKDKNLKLLKNAFADYYKIDMPTQIDHIKFLESLRYFVDYSDHYIADKWVSLAEQYCENGQYEKAKEIYEMVTFAPDATFLLANMIMSGKLGKPNYKLAYEYYRHTCLVDTINYFDAKVQIAKMHRDGKYFKPDFQIYKRMIKNMEKEFIKCGRIYPRLDNLYYELAFVEQADGNTEQAITYCLKARHWAKEYLTYGVDEETVMRAIKIFKLLYHLTKLDVTTATAFDLVYLLNAPMKAVLFYENKPYQIESFYEKDHLIVKFNEKYYKGVVQFFFRATLGGKDILHESNKITIIEVLQ